MEPIFTVRDIFSTMIQVFNMFPFYLKVIIILPIALEVLELIVDYYWGYKENQYLRSVGFRDIDNLSGLEFEKFLEILFKDLGYKVNRTQYAGDFGADLIIEKDNRRTVVQAKRYRGKVGVKAIQEIVAAKNYYDADSCMVVTNSRFTDQAYRLAKKNRVQLVGRKRLHEMIREARKETEKAHQGTTEPSNTQSFTANIDNRVVLEKSHQPYRSNSAVCADCGKHVSEKVKTYCLEHPKEFLGNIYCFDCQQKIRKINREIQRKLSSEQKLS